MNALLISDTHFTDNPRDMYRWQLFSWLREAIPKNNVKYLFICGDITEEKDRHSAKLVNKIVEELLSTYKQTGLVSIYIIRGNHDGLNPTMPYFKFLGKYPCIQFIETPFAAQFSDREVLMLPHTTDPAEAWKNVELHLADFIFMHITVKGAVSESGQQLDGIPAGILAPARRAKIFSGDIHVPQTIKSGRVPVEYIGAPYPVNFGDSFKPRAILIKNNFTDYESISIPSIRRSTLVISPAAPHLLLDDFHAGDQIKVRIRLTQSEYGDWAQLKRQAIADCSAAKVELCGLELEKVESRSSRPRIAKIATAKTTVQVLDEYCSGNKLSQELTKIGSKLLLETEHGY